MGKNELKAGTAAAPLTDAEKAAAIEAAAIENAAKEANMTAMRDATFARIGELGATDKQGSGAITRAGFLFNAACRAGLMTEADAGKAWEAFAKGHNAAVVNSLSIEEGDATIQMADRVHDYDVADKSAISRFKTFARWQVVSHALGLGWFDRVSTLAAAIPAARRVGSDYNCLVRANRELADAADASDMTNADVKAGKFDVADSVITGWLLKPEKAEPADKVKADFDKKLADAINTLAKLAKEGKVMGLPAIVEQLRVAHGDYAKVKSATPGDAIKYELHAVAERKAA